MKQPTIYNEYSKQYVPVLEIWESYTGWYWYVTEKADPKDPNFCYGLVDGFEKEWGYFDLQELKVIKGVWKVKEIDVPYSKNIVMQEVV